MIARPFAGSCSDAGALALSEAMSSSQTMLILDLEYNPLSESVLERVRAGQAARREVPRNGNAESASSAVPRRKSLSLAAVINAVSHARGDDDDANMNAGTPQILMQGSRFRTAAVQARASLSDS